MGTLPESVVSAFETNEDSKNKRPTQTQNVTEIHDDELTLLMTQNANHVADLISDDDIPVTEGQGFTLVLGEFIPHPPHIPRIPTHSDPIIQECDLSRLFSLSLDEDDTIGNHQTPSLTEPGSSTAEDT
jgi:hypothetical protein